MASTIILFLIKLFLYGIFKLVNNLENEEAISSNGVVYTTLSSDGAHKGIWRSVDGQNWTNITDSLFPPVYGRIAIGVNPSNEDEVYFLAAETDNYGQHTDVFFNGEAWTSLWKYDASDS